MSIDLPSTPVAKRSSTSAFNNLTTFNELNKMVTLRTPSPILLLHKNPKRTVIPIPKFPTLLTPKASVPRKLALEAKEPLASGTRGLLHTPAALVHDQCRAIPVGTITPRVSHHRRFAERVAPFHKQFGAHQGPASVRIEELGAIQSRAGDFGNVVVQLRLDVPDHAVLAEGVGPAFIVARASE